jgi:hypothetical protein
MSVGRHGGKTLTLEIQSTRRKTYPCATLSTTNPKLTEPGVNPGLLGEWMALTA